MLMKSMFWRSWCHRIVDGMALLGGVAATRLETDKHSAWHEYALFVGAAFQRMLADDKPAVKRFHTFFDDWSIRNSGGYRLRSSFTFGWMRKGRCTPGARFDIGRKTGNNGRFAAGFDCESDRQAASSRHADAFACATMVDVRGVTDAAI